MASLVTSLTFVLSLVSAKDASTDPITPPKPNWAELSSENISAQYKLYGFNNCQEDDQRAILDALWEKHTITEKSSSYYINWNGAGAIDFFGDPSATKGNQDQIQQNLRNVWQFGNGAPWSGHNIQIFCHDRSMEGEHKEDCHKLIGNVGHIQVVSKYADGNDAMMFCDSWFSLPTLAWALKNGQASENKFDLTSYDNRAIPWISALLLKTDVGTWPIQLDGTPYLRHNKWNFPHDGRQFMSTPSSIKMVAKQGVRARLLSGVGTYAWFAVSGYLLEDQQIGHYIAKPYVPMQLQFDPLAANSSVEDDPVLSQLSL